MPTGSASSKGWFLRFLSLEAKFESLLFSLACGLLTALMLIYLLSSFSPIAIVIITSLSISFFSARLLLNLLKKGASHLQKTLIIIFSLLIGLVFALSLSFAALPTLGIVGMSTGAAFLTAYASAAVYVIIALSLVQLVSSVISNWKLSHQRNLKVTHRLAEWMPWIKNTSPTKSYSPSQKLYLIFGGICSLSAALVSGGLAYYGMTLVPQILLSLGIGWTIGTSLLIPFGIALFIITTLVLTKVILHSFIKRIDEARANKNSSLFNNLMNKVAPSIHFSQQPVLYMRLALKCAWNALFSYKIYKNFCREKKKTALSKAQFYTRSLILCSLFPLSIIGIAMSLYSNYLGSLQLFQQVFHFSEEAAVIACSIFTALGSLAFIVLCQESVEKGSKRMIENIQEAPFPKRIAKGFNEAIQFQQGLGSGYIAAFSQRLSSPFVIAASTISGFVNSVFLSFLSQNAEAQKTINPGRDISPSACAIPSSSRLSLYGSECNGTDQRSLDRYQQP